VVVSMDEGDICSGIDDIIKGTHLILFIEGG
jgi:hypothetical protein